MRRGWLMVFMAACGGGSDEPDATRIDATPPIDSGPPGPVTVTTLSRCCDGPPGVPVEGVSVMTGGFFGEVVTTDASGVATIVVEPGASVTAVYPAIGDGLPAIVSWAGVAPGDALVFGEHSPVLPAATRTATITWTAETGHDGYYLWDGCTSGAVAASATSATIAAHGTVCGEPTTDVLLVALAGGVPIRWSMLLDVAVVDGATLTMPPFADATTLATGVTGLPASFTNVSVWAAPHMRGVEGPAVFGEGKPSGGSFQVTGPWTAAPQIRAEFVATVPDYFGRQVVTRLLDGDATSAVIEAPELPPWIAAIGVSGPDLTLTLDGSGPYGMTLIDLAWGSDPEQHWRVFAPPGRDLDLPVLHSQFDDLNPDPFVPVYPSVTLVDIDGRSYDEIRALPEWEVRGQAITLSRNESHDF